MIAASVFSDLHYPSEFIAKAKEKKEEEEEEKKKEKRMQGHNNKTFSCCRFAVIMSPVLVVNALLCWLHKA